MDITSVDRAVQRYLEKCVAPSVLCLRPPTVHLILRQPARQPTLPSDRRDTGTLCSFSGAAEPEAPHHKRHLSGLRFAQIHQGLGDPFRGQSMPLLEYVLTGLKRQQARAAPPPKPRLPITPDIMERLRRRWCGPSASRDQTMLWAAACTGFFGFLRAGEFTVPSLREYDPEVHLSLADLAVDSHTNPTLIRVRIKQSKTDPFRLGADIFLGASSAPICHVQALVNYIAVRSPGPGPLFCFESGSPLSRASMVSEVQQALTNTGLEAAGFTGHSFRIGAATTAAKRGFEDSLNPNARKMEDLGIPGRIPRQDLAGVARKLMEH